MPTLNCVTFPGVGIEISNGIREDTAIVTSNQTPAALVVTRNLPPMFGGMERLVWHIVDELRPDYHLHVIGPRGCSRHLPADVTVTEIPLSPLPLYLLRTLLASIRQAMRVKPVLVFAGSGLTAPFAWLAAKLTHARYACYLHGLDIEARHPIYRAIWLPFIRQIDQAFVNSHFTRALAIRAGVPAERITVLYPGVELPMTSEAQELAAEFRERYTLGNAPIMLYVGRITARKGLSFLAEYILPKVLHAVPEAQLVVIGDQAKNAVLKGDFELKKTHQILQALELETHAHFLGPRTHDDLDISAAYFAADVQVFPVQHRTGDNEGFGMVAIEAAAHGLPTVAFAVGGISDAIQDGVSGALVAPGDSETFAYEVIKRLDGSIHKPHKDCKIFAAAFAWNKFGQVLRHHLQCPI